MLPVLLIGRRREVGKKAKGFIPGVIYGSNSKTIHVEFEEQALRKVLEKCRLKNQITIQLEDREITGKIKEVQKHLTKNRLLHVDIQAIH
ncbi:hypothetical protein [Anaerobranca gottschalkii]|uniref:Ribosomal protein L25 (General stress protein Ctc) n=1 Tax=Anaerobranca gottschalkii DSM 13577 TaxID=1120990 RepID=A0A1I0B6W1_9FIRM|nr:hypothetical protein [Anaerobranca gottschalkii]SET02511.1 Ribosomal protein L25 (general stress protein Ctc) [Anaerobranca gottschalkii DSM 13577]